MKDYHELENEIISIFNEMTTDENNQEIIKLLKIFQKYWKSYQDNWPSHYWDIYNIIFTENQKIMNSESKDNNIKGKNLLEGSIISEDDFKNGIELEKKLNNFEEINQINGFLISDGNCDKETNRNFNKKLNKNNITKDQTKSLTNLDDIDKEIDGEYEKSLIKDAREDKNRNCLDCTIL